MKPTINIFAIAAGVSAILYYWLFYWFYRDGFFYAWVQWGGLIPILVFMGLACRNVQALQPDERPPLKALIRTAFIVFIFGTLGYHLTFYLLLNYDTGLLEIQRATMLQNMEAAKQWAGDEAAGNYREMLESETPAPYTLWQLIFALMQSLIGGFILSLILAYGMRSRLR